MRIALLTCTLLLAACGEAERIAEQFRATPATPHERYARVLEDAGLLETALGRDWLAAADAALESPVPVSLPYRERAYFTQSEASAGSWSFTLRRGERIRITLAREDTSTFAVFADLYEMPEDSTDTPERRAWADSLAMGFLHDARSDARFVLRVQPELLRTGSVTVTIERGPSLAFPVQDRDTRAIQSFWGAGRDGGRRTHEGVDIFAPRGTPVLAAVDGVIRSTRPNNLGGIVVWLRDEAADQSLYYAHLDTQVVERGQRVRVGDTLGFVGNSGNARTTPPHLHFGIYVRGEGAVDPLPFVREGQQMERPVISSVQLGNWVRTRAGAEVYQDPSRVPAPRRSLDRGTPLLVLGASTNLLRVRLPDGTTGFVPPRVLEGMDRALAAERFDDGAPVLSEPAPLAPAVATAPDEPLEVFGRFGGYAFVRVAGERAGWVAMD
jgi:murein DD-endopeptidase MepM/ murein hydrolase activator NlpD